ncbi:MAG: butyrate kinase [Treponema sp.]|nr:butyrate kinase [Treponema sp.]
MNMPKSERVELLVQNTPGVLGRVAAHIRLEGWNIKRLFVDTFSENEKSGDDDFIVIAPEEFAPCAPGSISKMIIEIEGIHTKLVQVAERLLRLDCVIAVGTMQGSDKVMRRRENKQPVAQKAELRITKAPPKPENTFRILIINPGSTSTKLAVYDNETEIFSKTVQHRDDELRRFPSILEQKDFRKDCILSEVQAAGILPGSFDAVSGRGGLLKPIESGAYLVGDAMLADLQTAAAAIHASALGAIIAAEIAGPLSIPAYVVDPVVVDEMDRNAKLTGMPGIERSSVFHALNQKAIARRVAEKIGKVYENARFVIAHLGGGITVGAHRYGRVIDVNDALSGEGPFTPERAGGVPAVSLINMCFSGEYTREELLERINGRGGMRGYLGTSDERAVQKMINDGDEFAALVLDSMAYQVSKEIGSMVAVLEGRVDAIVLTGGLAHSNRFTGAVKQRVDRLAPLYVFPGEDEMLALMSGALRVLRGEEAVVVYE